MQPGEMSSRIVERFREVTASQQGSRYDLRVTDVAEIEKDSTYKLVISYDQAATPPTRKDVTQFVKFITNDSVKPIVASARVHQGKRHSGVSIVVESRKLTRNLKDKSSMVAVAGQTSFMDTEIGEIWSVKTNEATGTKYLECQRREDIGNILDNALHAGTKTCAGLTLGDETVAGACCAEKGDTVQFYADNATRQGVVTSVRGDEARIAESDGNTFIVPVTSVIDIIKKNEKVAQEELNEQAEFYSKYLGKDFVRQMFPNANI